MDQTTQALFHLSIPVEDLDRAKAFYIDTLGCTVGEKPSAALISISLATI